MGGETRARWSGMYSPAYASPEIEQISHKLDAVQKALPTEVEARRTEMNKIFDENPVTAKITDVWAWGVTMLMLHTGDLPLNSKKASQTMDEFANFCEAVHTRNALQWNAVWEYIVPVMEQKKINVRDFGSLPDQLATMPDLAEL